MLYLIYKEVCEYDQEGNATDHRPTHDRRQRAEETEKKMELSTEHRRQQNGSNTLPTSLPHKTIGATIFIINNESQQQNHRIKTANTTGGGYLNAF